MSLKEIKARIASVRSTRKTTSAMKMVSSVKLRKAQQSIECVKPYSSTLRTMLSQLISSNKALTQTPLIAERTVKHCIIVALASDTSLCGAFNSNINNRLKKECDALRQQDISFTVIPIGDKVAQFAQKQTYWNVDLSCSHLADNKEYAQVQNLCHFLVTEFLEQHTDCVKFVYTHFVSAGQQKVDMQCVLPFPYNDFICNDDASLNADYIIEPDQERFFGALLPCVLENLCYSLVLESYTSEHAARVIAMQTATDNTDKLIDELTMMYNKLRQQAITNELLDLMGGESQN